MMSKFSLENTKGYRPDIDGLRAIAVLLVVIYHAGFETLSGGFIGVDVFFVISGFLITGIIKKDIQNNQFRFSTFYKRRIRRLMPALFFTLLLTSLFSSLILLPNDLMAYGYSLVSVIFSVSNMYFWRANGGYFEGNTQEVPLLHTWSLSVEEQFYLVWPVILILLYRFLSEKWILALLAIGLIISIQLSEYVSQVTFGAAYYLLPTRAFELMLGSILALAWSRIPLISVFLSQVCMVVGLTLIFYSAFTLNGSSNFPGYNAVIPTLGATLLILSGKSESHRLSGILTNKVMVKVGLISYSLYLVHWPIIVFVRYIGVELTPLVSTLLVMSSILLGWISWRYIELPFRGHQSESFLQSFKNLYLTPSVLTGTLFVSIILTSGFTFRFDDNIQLMEQAVATKPAQLRTGCHSPSRNSHVLPNTECSLGSDQATKKALLIGDSHSNHYAGFFDVLGERSNVSIMDYTMDECLPLFDLNWGHNQYYSQICRQRNEVIEAYIADNTFDYVIIAGHWPGQYALSYVFDEAGRSIQAEQYEDHIYNSFITTLTMIKESGAEPILMKDMSPSGHASPKCHIKEAVFDRPLGCNVAYSHVQKRDQMMERIFSRLENQVVDLKIIDPKLLVCDEKQCLSILDNTPLFLDRNHLNDMGSRVLGQRYLEVSESPF